MSAPGSRGSRRIGPTGNAPYLQTLAALEKIEGALKQLGSSRDDVVRTRIYLRNMKHEEEAGEHGEDATHGPQGSVPPGACWVCSPP